MSARTTLTGCLVAALALCSSAKLRAGDDAKPLVREEGKIAEDDPKDKVVKKSGHKVHEIKLEAGKTYRIDMTSREIDSFLRLEKADGKQVALDDDGGGFPNARIIYKADADGQYKIIATTFDGKSGAYTLTVNLAGPVDILETRVKSLGKASVAERNDTINELTKHLKEQGAKSGKREVNLAMQAAMSLERVAPKQAASAYKDYGKILKTSSDPAVAKTAARLEGCARRLSLPGNSMEVKGATLDGKEFDLAALKGKVVLVDFWATWCGPCIAEIPNMTKMYSAYKDRGFEIIGISVDADREKLDSFLEKRKLPWPTLHDQAGEGKTSLSDHYGVMFIPLPILVDRDGKVVSLSARGRELEQLLEKHIGPVQAEEKK
jgi:thiol-disulfide isomerase/thioredoxin